MICYGRLRNVLLGSTRTWGCGGAVHVGSNGVWHFGVKRVSHVEEMRVNVTRHLVGHSGFESV